MNDPYNPLAKVNLARSIELELLLRPPIALAELGEFEGAGIYVIYYAGDFPAYSPIRFHSEASHAIPIYVGKAIPKGGRKGGLTKDSSRGTALRDRLRQHAVSIDEAQNLALSDFLVRHLTVDDIWIPLGENMLIESYKPVWNRAIDGFGNKDPGNRRKTQYRSPWDVIHPGRKFAEKLAQSPVDASFLERRTADYLAGRRMQALPKTLKDQLASEMSEAQDTADGTEL